MSKQTTNELLKQFGLDWSVDKRPLFFQDNEGEYVRASNKEDESRGYHGLVRGDNNSILGHCQGSSYHVSQPKMILDTLKQFADKHGFEVARGGFFNGGKKVFFQLKAPKNILIGKNDVEQYIFAANSYDHSCRMSFGYTNTVISCSNTFNTALKDTRYRIKNTQSAEEKILEIPNLLEAYYDVQKEIDERLNVWSGISVPKGIKEDLIAYLTKTDKNMTKEQRDELSTRSKNILEGIEQAINKEVKEKGDTLWGLFNGITYYANHLKSYPQRENGQLESVLVGTANQMMHKAFNKIEEYAA